LQLCLIWKVLDESGQFDDPLFRPRDLKPRSDHQTMLGVIRVLPSMRAWNFICTWHGLTDGENVGYRTNMIGRVTVDRLPVIRQHTFSGSRPAYRMTRKSVISG
jgi:hypothetical protein